MKPGATNPIHILVVDDEECVRELLEISLSAPGREVRAARTADEAMKHANKHPVDLAILDLILRGMDGLQLATRIKQTHPGAYIVLCTGVLPAELPEPGLRKDVDRILHKPFDLCDIVDIVNACAGKIRLRCVGATPPAMAGVPSEAHASGSKTNEAGTTRSRLV